MSKNKVRNTRKKENPALMKARLEAITKARITEMETNVRASTIHTFEVMTIMVLADKFNFSKDKLREFINSMNSVADSIIDDYVTVDDMVEVLHDELGFSLTKDDIAELYPDKAKYLK